MRTLKSFTVFFVLFFAHVCASYPQTSAQPKNQSSRAKALPGADEIAAKCAKGSGGKEAWAKVSTQVMSGTVESNAGITGKVEITSKAPNKVFHMLSFADGQFVQKSGFDGQVGWEFDSQKGLKRLEGAELEEARIEGIFDSEVRLREVYPDMKVTGRAKVGDRDTYTVLMHSPRGKAITSYFDAETGLRIAYDSEGPDQSGKIEKTKILFEDHRPVDGIQIPFRIRITSPSISLVVHIQDVKNNVPVDDSIFAMPSTQPTTSDLTAGGASAANTPDDGEVEGHTYKNRFFGLRYEFPEGWTVHGEETKKRIMEIGKSAVAGDDPLRKSTIETAEKHTRIVLSVFQYPLGTPTAFNQSIQIMFEDVAYAPGIQTGKDYMQAMEKTLRASNVPMEMQADPVEIKVGNKTFYRLDIVLHARDKSVYEAFCVTVMKQHALSFVFITGSEENRASLVKTLDSARLDQ